MYIFYEDDTYIYKYINYHSVMKIKNIAKMLPRVVYTLNLSLNTIFSSFFRITPLPWHENFSTTLLIIR